MKTYLQGRQRWAASGSSPGPFSPPSPLSVCWTWCWRQVGEALTRVLGVQQTQGSWKLVGLFGFVCHWCWSTLGPLPPPFQHHMPRAWAAGRVEGQLEKAGLPRPTDSALPDELPSAGVVLPSQMPPTSALAFIRPVGAEPGVRHGEVWKVGC